MSKDKNKVKYKVKCNDKEKITSEDKVKHKITFEDKDRIKQ